MTVGRTYLLSAFGLVLLVIGALVANHLYQRHLAAEDEETERANTEHRYFPPDLDCARGLAMPMQRAVNDSPITDALVDVQGHTVSIDSDHCDADTLHLVAKFHRVSRLLDRCRMIERLVCSRQGSSIAIKW